MVAEVLMPAAVERDIRLIVVKKVELNRRIAGTIEEKLIYGVGIRADSIRVFNTMRVLEDCHFFCEEITHRLLSLGIAIDPEWLHGVECASNTFHVSITVLNDNALNSTWMF